MSKQREIQLETIITDVKIRNKQLRIESVKSMENEIELLENKILLLRKWIKFNEELMNIGY
tara:strand:+ start:5997 stop:6179 length:183 start_codon:yes stop_codon:yes gene_type:complete